MITNQILDDVIHLAAKYDLVSSAIISKFRLLNTTWKRTIESNFREIDLRSKSFRFIQLKLCYDKTRYNEYSYKRRVLHTYIEKHLNDYFSITIPQLVIQKCSIFGSQHIIKAGKMTEDYYVYLDIYFKFPSPLIRPYPVYVLKEIISEQFEWVKLAFIKHGSENLVLLEPICYVKHFSNFDNDDQFIAVLCWCNVLNLTISTFGNQYKIIKLRPNDLEDKKLHHTKLKEKLSLISTHVLESKKTKYILKNVLVSLNSFSECFDKMLKLQNFNL